MQQERNNWGTSASTLSYKDCAFLSIKMISIFKGMTSFHECVFLVTIQARVIVIGNLIVVFMAFHYTFMNMTRRNKVRSQGPGFTRHRLHGVRLTGTSWSLSKRWIKQYHAEIMRNCFWGYKMPIFFYACSFFFSGMTLGAPRIALCSRYVELSEQNSDLFLSTISRLYMKFKSLFLIA